MRISWTVRDAEKLEVMVAHRETRVNHLNDSFMPLGFFGGKDSSSKPQQLSATEDGKEKKEKKDSYEKDVRGTVLKLQKTTVTIEKKLAEGGFAIVYLVSDRQNRQYALKRQFISDDMKQVEACKREYQIVSSLRGHKNIVSYVDHLLTQNKKGIYDYMLLTSYYKTSVLQLMNDRLAAGRCLTVAEILSIFCNMCEAVARLHHSQTPVIHRDLKIENILIDERNRAAPPIYVLCDFGSATTKVLSSNTHAVHYIQEEVERYTTLSYRAPEMIDVYQGKPIGVKIDTWAMGVMLYKLCYFTLPFGESAMAIQNGAFSFPLQPVIPDSVKAIIKLLLEADIDKRPSIYQCSALAFEAAGVDCPVNNVYNVATIKLSNAIDVLLSGKPLTCEEVVINTPPVQTVVTTKAEVNTAPLCSTSPTRTEMTTTSVNPRLRPKPMQSIPSVPLIPMSPKLPSSRPHGLPSSISTSQPEICSKTSGGSNDSSPEAPLSCPLAVPPDLGFTDLDATVRDRAQTDGANNYNKEDKMSQSADGPNLQSVPSLPMASAIQAHRRNVSDTSQIIKSAFKPYSQTITTIPSTTNDCFEKNPSSIDEPEQPTAANPFMEAPFTIRKMDDDKFGKEFDGLPRNLETGDSREEYDSTSIDSLDPFGAAPFDPPQRDLSLNLNDTRDDDSVGSAEDLKRRMQEDDSELDEQRMTARRRYSYEHIDGVGEDGSSDSRGRTEGDSTDDHSRNESSHDEDNDSSQQTDIASDDGGGRPLLEDDGLEDDDDRDHSFGHYYDENEVFNGRIPTKNTAIPLSIDPRKCTNPFLNSDNTPKISPALESNQPETDVLVDTTDFFVVDNTPNNDDLFKKPSFPLVSPLDSAYAPATLPRQVTPLSATPKPQTPRTVTTTDSEVTFTAVQPPALPLVQPVTAVPLQEPVTQMVPKKSAIHVPPVSCKYSPAPSYIEGPKTPKAKHKSKERERMMFNLDSTDSEMETDGSEAEMCSSQSSDKVEKFRKKKKNSAFALLSNNTSQEKPTTVSSITKKVYEKRKISTTSGGKRGSTGAINASFVNNSFQAEDMDSPTF